MGSAMYLLKISVVPPVIIKVMKEKKTTFLNNPHRIPFLFLTNLAKALRSIKIAKKYLTII